MHSDPEGYEYLDVPMPVVGIVCKDEKGEEEIIVIKDCADPDGPPWTMDAICAACEDAYAEWASKR
jgi:hypothetical protein|tara:strand:+ start:190 stop:387 length:198 start_codon:yes stop_codon:yes gene_type:complete